MAYNKTIPRFFEELLKDKKTLFLLILIIFAFIVQALPLLLFPIPEYLHNTDVSTHYKRVELINRDIKYIAYDAYPKGFHLMTAALSPITGIGTAMAAITVLFSIVFLFFTYKLAMFFLNDKHIALLTTFFAATLSVAAKVPGFASPLPQSIALALIVMALYLIITKHFFLAGLAIGFHSIVHLSWPLNLFLVSLFFVVTNKTGLSKAKEALIYFVVGFLVFFIPYNIINYLAGLVIPIELATGTESFLKHSIEWKISPLSFHEITSPPFFILIACFGMLMLKKKTEKKHFFLVLWFFLLILASQMYWVIESSASIGKLLGIALLPSRFLCFIVFPLSFFAAVSTLKIAAFNKKLSIYLWPAISLGLIYILIISAPQLNVKPSFTHQELNLIKELKKLPVDAIVLTPNFFEDNALLELGLKKSPSLRDRALILSDLDTIDTNHIDYAVVKDGENYLIIDPEKKPAKFLWLNNQIEVKKKHFNKTKALSNYVAAFMVTQRGALPLHESAFKIVATDTKEEVCFPEKTLVSTGEPCTDKNYVVIKGKKADLIELFDSFDPNLFMNKLTYFYREKKISFNPEPIMQFEDGETTSLMRFSLAYKWTNAQVPLSKRNIAIGKFLLSVSDLIKRLTKLPT
jgi:hypothetical protein